MLKIFVLLVFLTACHAKLKIETDGSFEYCGKTDPKEYYIIIKTGLVYKNDELFINGTWTFLTDINVWPMKVTLERKTTNGWFRLAEIAFANFCDNIKNPLDIVFQIFSKHPGCPIKKGDVWLFDMQKVPTMGVPEGFAGDYRITFEHNVAVDGRKKRICFATHGKLVKA